MQIKKTAHFHSYKSKIWSETLTDSDSKYQHKMICITINIIKIIYLPWKTAGFVQNDLSDNKNKHHHEGTVCL